MSVAFAPPWLLSHALRADVLPFPSHSTVMFEAACVITGASASSTVTVNVQLELFPHKSVAVAVTDVVPLLKKLPGAMLYTMVGAPEQLSVAVAA